MSPTSLADIGCSPSGPVPTKNLVGQPPEVTRTACPSPFGTIRRASVLPQKTKVRIANGHTARSAFPHERLQIVVVRQNSSRDPRRGGSWWSRQTMFGSIQQEDSGGGQPACARSAHI